MNSSTWISNQEKKHLAKIAKELEYRTFFGHSPNDTKRRNAIRNAQDLHINKSISSDQMNMLLKMINADAEEDLDFAITLIKHISTQNSTQDGSNISGKESPLQEPRPQ